MFEMKRPTSVARVPCKAHGVADPEPDPLYGPKDPSLEWNGAIVCSFCMRVYLCEETAEKFVYPDVPADGFCVCGSSMFPRDALVGENGPVFAAQPKCGECAKILWARQHPETAVASP